MTDSLFEICFTVCICIIGRCICLLRYIIGCCICPLCYISIRLLWLLCVIIFCCICLLCGMIYWLFDFCCFLWPRKGKKLRAPKLIGRTAHKSFKRMWDLVMDSQSRIIGVQGMTGVGKTNIMRYIYHQIRNTQSDQYDEVMWIFPNRIGYIHEEEIKLLENKKRILFFMDDVEDDTEMLPFIKERLHFTETNKGNGCKLVFTTRSVDVCTRMGCKEDSIVKVELLSEKEALELFWDTVDVKGNRTPRMTNIAEEVVKECARLPLMIVAVGKKLRRVKESRWAKLLSNMRNSDRGIMDFIGNGGKPRMPLRIPMYDISRFCVLYPKDWNIPTKELIKYMIALDKDGGEQQLMLLKSNEIFKSVEIDFEDNHEWGEGVQIQPLYRDLNFAYFSNTMISKCGLMLEELPEEVKWSVNLTWASFMYNNIRTISISPKCPRLSVLFLNKNPDLCTISHRFFVHMTGLRILDLRDNLKMEKLPDSISDLIDLRVLRLSRCRSLKQVPSLAKLLHMQMLELDETAIEELPHGIEMLVELTVLKLHSLSLREAIPSDYLSMLHSLPHLELHL